MVGGIRARAAPFAASAALAFALGAGAATSCANKGSAVGPGGECFLASDCEPGLVCIEQENKARVCSNDLTRVAGQPPMMGGGEAGANEGGGEGGPPPEGGTEDTGAPDTGVDSGPKDAGADG